MSESIYAPPEADIAAPATDEPRYYVVASTKFIALSIMTFTLYFVYWFYRNWRQIKAADSDDLWPVPRAIFYIFFTHSLFADVAGNIESQKKQYDWSPVAIASLFVLLTIISNGLDRVMEAANMLPNLYTIAFGLSLPFILTGLLLRAQRAINFASGDPDGEANEQLTTANWLWVILGGLLWLFVLFGVYVILVDPSLFE